MGGFWNDYIIIYSIDNLFVINYPLTMFLNAFQMVLVLMTLSCASKRRKTREHRLEAGVGFLQLCTWWLNQKSPFYTVIYSILCLWSMMFWRLLQDVKMPKKTFAIPQHLLEVQCILFSLSALSVGILRFEELAQSLDVLMLVCKSKLPWSHIDH